MPAARSRHGSRAARGLLHSGSPSCAASGIASRSNTRSSTSAPSPRPPSRVAFEGRGADRAQREDEVPPVTVNQDILRAVGLVRSLDKPLKILKAPVVPRACSWWPMPSAGCQDEDRGRRWDQSACSRCRPSRSRPSASRQASRPCPTDAWCRSVRRAKARTAREEARRNRGTGRWPKKSRAKAEAAESESRASEGAGPDADASSATARSRTALRPSSAADAEPSTATRPMAAAQAKTK